MLDVTATGPGAPGRHASDPPAPSGPPVVPDPDLPPTIEEPPAPLPVPDDPSPPPMQV